MSGDRKRSIRVTHVIHGFKCIAVCQSAVFLMLLLVVWANELLDPPALWFELDPRPPDITRGVLASLVVVMAGVATVASTYFQKKRILYLKKKHCDDPDCRDPKHMVKKTTWWGPVPTGSKIVHCDGCKDLAHYVWKVRGRHEVTTPFLDMISALFVSLSCEFKVGAAFTVPVVQDRDRWNVVVTPVKEERIKLCIFDCFYR